MTGWINSMVNSKLSLQCFLVVLYSAILLLTYMCSVPCFATTLKIRSMTGSPPSPVKTTTRRTPSTSGLVSLPKGRVGRVRGWVCVCGR